MNQQEEWRPIAGFPDYIVSDLGQVASIKRGHLQILAGGKTDSGYRNVLLYNAGHRTGHRVHALVAAAFHGPRPEGLEIRHLDGDQLNNTARNLRYGTAAENQADKRRHRGLLLIVGKDPIPSWVLRREAGNGRRRFRRVRPVCAHPKDEANTYVYPSGHATCRPCKSATEAASRTRRLLRAAGISSTERAA